MKRAIITAILAASIPVSDALARNAVHDPPPYYSFNYRTQPNGQIDQSSVCRQYSGGEWRECRRYANWWFNKQCWDLGYQVRHQTGQVRQDTERKRQFMCHAKGVVTTL